MKKPRLLGSHRTKRLRKKRAKSIIKLLNDDSDQGVKLLHFLLNCNLAQYLEVTNWELAS